MNAELRVALANAKLFTDGKDYCLVGLPQATLPQAHDLLLANLPAFWAVIADKDEVSLLIPFDIWVVRAESLTLGRFRPRVTTGYRLITFNVVLPPSLVGFLAYVTKPLADAGIPILAFSASARDHLFVPKEQFSKAWAILEDLIATARAI